MQIEKMFDANTWDDESEFRRAILQIVDRLPEFALADVMLFDKRHGAFKEVTHDRLQTGIAAGFIHAARTVKQGFDFLRCHQVGHLHTSPWTIAKRRRIIKDQGPRPTR